MSKLDFTLAYPAHCDPTGDRPFAGAALQHGVLLVAGGQSCGSVAELFGEDARTVQRWVQRFERQCFEGLREGERGGRPRLLDVRQWRRLGRELRLIPLACGHEQNLWDGKLVSEHLRMRYGVALGVHQCQRLTAQTQTSILPPYCPHLAPIERVWRLTRRLATHNRYFATLDELVAVASRPAMGPRAE